MHKRFYGQRQHIIDSIDSALYQLHILSFFQSPSIWILLCRIIPQFHFARPREAEPNGTLRFFYGMVLLFNFGPMWWHFTWGAEEGRVIILDFIGMSNIPSRFQLFLVDIFIVTMQLLLITVAYETSVFYASPDAEPEDPLLPDTPPHFAIPMFQQPPEDPSAESSAPLLPTTPKQTIIPDIPLVIDLQMKPIREHLRNPPPPSQLTPSIGLPGGNAGWPLPVPGMRMFMRARRQIQGTTTAEITEPQPQRPTPTPTPRERRIPGALDPQTL